MPSGGRTGSGTGTPGGPRTALPALKKPSATPSASESAGAVDVGGHHVKMIWVCGSVNR